MNLPEFDGEELTEESLRIHAFFYAGMDWFDGHFDFRRIFPGVGQLYVIGVLAEKYFGISLNRSGVCFDSVKYSRVILPDTATVITVTLKKGRGLGFVIADAADEKVIYSQGKCSFPDRA